MATLFQTRLANYQKKLFRYLKYVFNDHLSLLLLFILGGFVYYYTALLKQAAGYALLAKIGVVLVYFGCLFFGKLATLIEEADKVFLLPKEEQLDTYLKKAYQHSLPLPLLMISGVVGFTFPLLLIVGQQTPLDALALLASLFSLKLLELCIQKTCLFQITSQTKTQLFLGWSGLSLVSLIVAVFVNVWVGVVVAVIGVLLLYRSLQKLSKNSLYDWHNSVELEQKRQKKIYQFINLFTDVPGMTSSVKRRKWLDPLLDQGRKTTANTYFYLFTRRFLRGTEYSGLFIRLLLLGCVMILSTKEIYLALPIALVTVFLICFQLLPLYQQFDYMVLSALYPIDPQQKKQNLQKLLAYLMTLLTICLSGCFFISLQGKQALLASVSTCLFASFLVAIYVPFRLKKMKATN